MYNSNRGPLSITKKLTWSGLEIHLVVQVLTELSASPLGLPKQGYLSNLRHTYFGSKHGSAGKDMVTA